MFSGSVDAGFILALPFQHGDLEPDCVGVSTRKGGTAASVKYVASLSVEREADKCSRC